MYTHYQGIEDVVLVTGATDYTMGGINMTGLQMVHSENIEVDEYLKHWQTLDRAHYPGAGVNKISVRLTLMLKHKQNATCLMH